MYQLRDYQQEATNKAIVQSIELNTRQNFKCNYEMMPESFTRKVNQQ
jgi:hypothetical protein